MKRSSRTSKKLLRTAVRALAKIAPKNNGFDSRTCALLEGWLRDARKGDTETITRSTDQAAVTEGGKVTIMVIGDDLFYGGNASFTFNITANPSVAPVLTGTVSGTISPGIWFADFPITAPAHGNY